VATLHEGSALTLIVTVAGAEVAGDVALSVAV
jgi:hypothetical protein